MSRMAKEKSTQAYQGQEGSNRYPVSANRALISANRAHRQAAIAAAAESLPRAPTQLGSAAAPGRAARSAAAPVDIAWVPKPYEFIGFGAIDGTEPYKIHRVW